MFNIIVGTNQEGSLSLVAAQDISAIYTDLGIENQLLLLSDLPPKLFLRRLMLISLNLSLK